MIDDCKITRMKGNFCINKRRKVLHFATANFKDRHLKFPVLINKSCFKHMFFRHVRFLWIKKEVTL